MAQKTENEETEFKVPETLTLCVNNCGVTGNPATNNMCQKCFNASSSAPATSSSSASSSSSSTTPSQPRRSRNEIKLEVVRRSEQGTSDPAKKAVNRCNGCKRKVGLTGFRCRCGELFCWEHRYSDRHDCSFDYKAAGREAIARENPVVKAAKIVRV